MPGFARRSAKLATLLARGIFSSALAAGGLIFLVAWAGYCVSPAEADVFGRGLVLRPGEEVEVQSDEINYYRSSDLYVARGGVSIRYGENVLTADQVVLDRKNKVFTATGNVRLSDGESVLTSDRVVTRLEDRTGLILGGTVYLRDSGYRFSGEKIEKVGDDEFIIRRGSFTTCDCGDDEAPSWHISARSIWVTVGGYARVQNALFYIKGVPVLYLPFGYFPVKTEREFGLLFPTLLYSEKYGFEYKQGLFIPLGPSADATLWLNYYSALGYGASGEFRYVGLRGSYGTTNLQYIRQTKQDGVETSFQTERFLLDSTHRYNWGDFEAAVADIHLVSDRRYFAELGTTLDQQTKQFTRSEVTYWTSWENVALLPQAEIIERLGRDFARSVNRLPHAETAILPFGVVDGGPVVSGTLTADNFVAKTPGPSVFETEAYRTVGQRAYVSGRVEQPMLFGAAQVIPYLAGSETAYRSTFGEGSSHREVLSTGSRLGAPFERTFFLGEGTGTTLLTHRISPMAHYRFVPNVMQDELPIFDEFDRVRNRNVVEYGLENDLFWSSGVESGSLRLGVFRHYDFAAEALEHSPVLARLHYASPVGLRLSATEYFDPDAEAYRAYHGVYRAEADLLGGTGWVEYHRMNNYLVSDRTRVLLTDVIDDTYTRYASPLPWASRELWGTVSRRFFDHLTLLYGARYSIDRKLLLESSYGIDFLSFCNCWSVQSRFIQRPNNDIVFNLTFTLVGVGSLGN